MVLREVMAGFRYAVYAYCLESDESCPVEQFMLDHRHNYPIAIKTLNALLREWTPQWGPPFESEELAKRLRDGACEFKGREKKKPDRLPRIFFFEDDRLVICSNAVMKPFPGNTPEESIEECLRVRAEYFAAKSAGEDLRILRAWGV